MVWGLHLDNHASGDSIQSICGGKEAYHSIHMQYFCILTLAEMLGCLPNIHYLFLLSQRNPNFINNNIPSFKNTAFSGSFHYRCPYDTVSWMKCKWTHWISLLRKRLKRVGWLLLCWCRPPTSLSMTNCPFSLPFFFPGMWTRCWRSFSHLGTTGDKQMLGILEWTKVPGSMTTWWAIMPALDCSPLDL